MKKFLFEISPGTRSLLADARRKPTLLERWSGEQRLLKIVAEVRAAREPGAIGQLLQLGLADSGSVRSAARVAIGDLLSLIPIEKVPELDEAVRREWGYLDVWYGLRPETLAATTVKTEENAGFLCVATCHPSGYVREQAVRGLGRDESPETLPFLLIRAVDWVSQVGLAAQTEIYRRLNSPHADAFVSCLSLLDRLRGSERFSPELAAAIERFLLEAGSAHALRKGLVSDNRRVRRQSFGLAVASSRFDMGEVVQAAARDADVVIRRWAFTFIRKEMPGQWPELRIRAARDSFAPIRRIAFESLMAESEPPRDQLLNFLLDASPEMRRSAQDFVSKVLNVLPRDYYRAVVDAERGPRNICALGLAEVGDTSDAPSIAVLMHDSSAKTRSAAIRALRSLGACDSDSLLKVLMSDVPSVAREAAITLLASRLVPAALVWKEALANPDCLVWRTVLKIFKDVEKWTRVTVYLEAAALDSKSLSAFALERLRIWIAQYNRSFALPQPSDAARISALIEKVRPKLSADLARELGFITETVLKPTHDAY